MLYFTHALNFLLMMALPILLGVFLARRLGAKWSLFGVGAVTFIASQVVHIPLNLGLTALFANHILPSPPETWQLPFNAIVLGLTAGLCEEPARYIVYRIWIKSTRTWSEALMFGAGHGGVEAIIFGILAGIAFLNMSVLRNVDVALLPVPANQQALAAQQISEYWSAPWGLTLLGAVERLFTLLFHLAMSLVVLQAVRRRNLLWLVAAILLHAMADAAGVWGLSIWGPYWAEVIIAVFGVASLVLIFALRPAHEEIVSEPVTLLPATAPSPPKDTESDLREKIDNSRFSA
jgi:uncharacterized membrane protein YhfC